LNMAIVTHSASGDPEGSARVHAEHVKQRTVRALTF
jgi:hypothetical protein